MSFILSKVLWAFFSPSSFLVLLLVLGAFLAVAHTESRRVIGRRICFAAAMLFFFVAIFPVGEWLLVPLENRFPAVRPDHVDGIILIGEDESPELAAARGVAAARASSGDYIMLASLIRQYPQAKLVYSGGSGMIAPDSDFSNAKATREVLTSLGIPVDRMLFEDKSRSTHENAVESAALVHATKQQKWLLVATAMHMPRTIACFRKAGLDVYPAPANYITDGTYSSRLRFALATNLSQMEQAMHEYMGLIAYKMQGYTDEIWPK